MLTKHVSFLHTLRAQNRDGPSIRSSHPEHMMLVRNSSTFLGCMASGAAGESCIPERDHCCRIIGRNPPANLIVRLRPVDVGLPAQPSPSSGAVELEKRVAMSEDVSEIDLEVGDGGTAWGRNVC